jgi:hypothetical protein
MIHIIPDPAEQVRSIELFLFDGSVDNIALESEG